MVAACMVQRTAAIQPDRAQTTISYEPVFCRPEIRPYFLMAALASSSLAMAAALSASAFSLRD